MYSEENLVLDNIKQPFWATHFTLFRQNYKKHCLHFLDVVQYFTNYYNLFHLNVHMAFNIEFT